MHCLIYVLAKYKNYILSNNASIVTSLSIESELFDLDFTPNVVTIVTNIFFRFFNSLENSLFLFNSESL
ncbi:MAG: hypothetical protein RL762_1102 [Bacteroidota bacterium]